MTSGAPPRPFGSLLTAMVTPMKDEDGAVDVDAARALAAHLVDNGHDGIVLNGTTGEAPTTHAPEKAYLVRAVVEEVGDRAVVLAGAGSNDTVHAVRMAEQAAEAGAHGLLVVTPYYSRPSQEGIYQHTLAVADATDLPVMLYDVPARTAVRYAPQTLDRLAEHPNVVAVKDATADLPAALRSIRRTGLAWYSGDDAFLLPFLSVGGSGLVSMTGHLAGRRLATVIEEFDRGEVRAATERFADLMPLVDLICSTGNGALRCKLTLSLLGLIPSAAMRLPQVPAAQDEVDAVRTILVAEGLLDTAEA
ncbi:4-hydroxy-tetrahydrodipicolinate synthase [Cellulomonas bogoriensis]|uniref:4-hydroxy-tetrahydrodipicolinate synthase n=1 Tax=Cellulomonas bogoriensis 69B4 = DSM 16987 TaxID=1386082 RepID=A0A0A0BVB5_9CELL|nr:4-hydroxy-tetrahydrodipicolinate synthase [Cellulomonas bogoriensis]KGM12318.1 dihydrodipicolinate synthase [Cellulomonas bogoriensis 69B4 = DSM 16987]